ncbi:MAG: TdeIII family type II restriction endonuclease [Mariprofundaceae bacterium]|nr:TdeIII family type II restriction endonuclease [Mariprofundaceae bacterium]
MKTTKEDNISKAIKNVISELMNRVMNKVLIQDPFIKEKHHSAKPLYAALVPDEIFKGSHFERRFVTPFGGVWEKLAKVVATEAHGNCMMGHTITGTVGSESLRRIQEVLNKLEHKEKGKERINPDWKREMAYIKNGGGELISTSVVCDIFIESDKTGKKYAFELKGPLPNSDQTKVSKEKIFKLLAMEPQKVDFAFYALPYNPYGKKEDYAWSFPLRWFDMKKDESVLIGNEFWNLIGGTGTYDMFVKEINTLGKEYKEQIYREFLGIDPLEGSNDGMLK